MMDEAEWLRSTDPAAMLHFLTRDGPTRPLAPGIEIGISGSMPTDRQLRLFACACCRQVWDGTECPWADPDPAVDHGGKDWREMACICHGTGRVGGLTDPRSRAAVEVAEQVADSNGAEGSYSRLTKVRREAGAENGWVWCATCLDIAVGLNQTLYYDGQYPIGCPPATQADLLRCLFGNPWRQQSWRSCSSPRCPGIDDRYGYCPKSPLAAWLSWQGGVIPELARRIYDERDWSALPVLADMLEEAGCRDEDILWHLRGGNLCVCRGEAEGDAGCPHCIDPRNGLSRGVLPAPLHARGCWALDLLLGKG